MPIKCPLWEWNPLSGTARCMGHKAESFPEGSSQSKAGGEIRQVFK